MTMLKRFFRLDYAELTPLWIAVFVDILGFSVLIPFLPYFSEEYGARDWQVGLLLSTNALFGFFSGPIWGRLSDRYGRKPMLLLAQLGTLIGFLMLAFSRSMPMLFASRIVDGIFGGNFPIAKAVIGDVVPPSERSKHMSNIGAAHVMASLIGPGVGGLLSGWGIIAPGLLSAALTCITITVTFRYLKESNLPEKHTAAQVATPLQRNSAVWQNPLARFLLIQWGFHTLSFIIYTSCISLFAKIQLGLNAQEIGLMLMISGAVRLLVRFTVFVPLLDKLGDRKTSLLGLVTFVIVFFLLGFVQNPVQFVLVMCGASFAAACTRGVLTGFLSRAVKPWEQGRAMGLSASLDSFAQIAGPIVGGFTLDYLPTWVYGGAASLVALAALLMGIRQLEFAQEGTAV
ncbi:MAG: MFS transporter [Anaerolineae bacterium]|nr:MFS transporter [Anaerolineae bacterium]